VITMGTFNWLAFIISADFIGARVNVNRAVLVFHTVDFFANFVFERVEN